MSNLPPGVSGSEYAISGPDYERDDVEGLCSNCGYEGDGFTEQGHRAHGRWIICPECHESTTLDDEDVGPDPDRAHDEMMERRFDGR